MEKTILYLIDETRALRFWSIESHDDGFLVEWGQVGSPNIQEEWTEVPFGKAGRDQEEQIESEVASKIKKRKENGYCETADEARNRGGRGLNDLGLVRPMLATPFKKIKEDVSDYYHQPKLDGHRCLINLSGLQPRAYSRNGKEITAIYEILDELKIQSNYTLDGELYYHGAKLQTISSWVKRRQDQTDLIEYWVYDIAGSQMTYAQRLQSLYTLFNSYDFVRIKMCPTVRGVEDATTILKSYKENGYEGGILRSPKGLYEPAKRSKELIKVKSFEDDEFTVHNITQSKDGWAILHLFSKTGKEFTVSAPGSVPEKRHVWIHREEYIGRDVRVEYAMLTADGVPFHPVATMWRNKGDE